ncbi:MAG: sugar ABC transporter substrate-binding protein [Pseudomonadota bacterium]
MLRWVNRLLLALALCLPPLAGAGPAAELEPYRVGVLYWSMNIPGQVAMRNGLEAEARRLNIDAALMGERGVELLPFVAGDGAEGIEKQIHQMRRLVEQSVDLIIVQPTDNAALAKALQAANRAGIPVVAYDQYIRGGELASYITSDNYQAGYLGGEYVAANFPSRQRIRLVLVEYPHVSSTVERVDGFFDALKANKQSFERVASYRAVEPRSGAEAGRAIVRDFPDEGSVDVVFTVNDGGGMSVVEQLQAAGRDEIFVASVDGDPRAVAGIGNGSPLRIDSAQFCGPMGELALRLGYRLLAGETVPRHVQIPAFPVTVETIEHFTSWHGPLPDGFDKPWSSAHPEWAGQLKMFD